MDNGQRETGNVVMRCNGSTRDKKGLKERSFVSDEAMESTHWSNKALGSRAMAAECIDLVCVSLGR